MCFLSVLLQYLGSIVRLIYQSFFAPHTSRLTVQLYQDKHFQMTALELLIRPVTATLSVHLARFA